VFGHLPLEEQEMDVPIAYEVCAYWYYKMPYDDDWEDTPFLVLDKVPNLESFA
jgi:hypothetical protein